jgi:hypothetical protein
MAIRFKDAGDNDETGDESAAGRISGSCGSVSERGASGRSEVHIHVRLAKRGRPRIEEIGQTISDLRPWEALGMSRATWYRRKKEKRQE